MKSFAIVVLISALLCVALASTVFTKDYSDPAHPGKCVFSDKVYDIGKHQLAEYTTFECKEGGMGTYISSHPVVYNKPSALPGN